MKITSIKTVPPSKNHSGSLKPTRIFFFLDSCSTSTDKETPLLEALVNRRNQPQREFRKLLPEVYKWAIKKGLLTSTHKTASRWSQTAGCQCPCSPGFVINARLGVNIYVDVVDDTKVAVAA